MKAGKRLLAAILAIVLLATLLPSLALFTSAQETQGGLVYSIENEAVIITGYTGKGVDLVIPAELEGYTVTAIGGNAFADCASLRA